MSSRAPISIRMRAAAAALAITALAAACRDEPPPTPTAPRGGLPVKPNIDPVAAGARASRDTPANGRRLDVQDDTAPPARTRYRVEHHGGPIAGGVTNVYVIWYGDWSIISSDGTRTVVEDFLINVGNSPYFSITQRYPDATGAAPSGAVVYGGDVVDGSYSHGVSLSDADVEAIIWDQFANFQLPVDSRGVYLVIPSPDITDTTGLNVTYCARHGIATIMGYPIRYAFIGTPSRAPTRCAPQRIGPNGTLNGDALVSHIAAELANSVTDPSMNAWYDKLGLEPADKCVWNFGTTYQAPNGALANVKIGDRHYLLQQLWLPSKNGGSCAMRP